MACIFVDKPKSCAVCLQSRKLSCLNDHLHMVVSENGEKELNQLLQQEIHHPRRYKTYPV